MCVWVGVSVCVYLGFPLRTYFRLKTCRLGTKADFRSLVKFQSRLQETTLNVTVCVCVCVCVYVCVYVCGLIVCRQ